MFNKPDFIGKDAILRIKEEGVTKRLAQFHLMNFDKVIHNNILISRNFFSSFAIIYVIVISRIFILF